jgi:hypothetical protein
MIDTNPSDRRRIEFFRRLAQLGCTMNVVQPEIADLTLWNLYLEEGADIEFEVRITGGGNSKSGVE